LGGGKTKKQNAKNKWDPTNEDGQKINNSPSLKRKGGGSGVIGGHPLSGNQREELGGGGEVPRRAQKQYDKRQTV